MKSGTVKALAILVNFSLCADQLLADLPPVTFDTLEWVPYQSVGQGAQPGWQLLSGNAQVSANGEGLIGSKALRIPANSQTETRITRAVTWNPSETTAFIDFHVKPAADPNGSLASFYANGTQIAFQVPNNSNSGEIWVYHGSDGSQTGATPKQWIKTAGDFTVAQGGTSSTTYLRITLRHDYTRNLWDLFVDGKLAAGNLAFESRGSNLQTIEFYGSSIGDTLIDELSARNFNMLFPDADKDGLSDAWEIANGSNPNLYDRDSTKSGTNGSYLDAYMASLWLTGGTNGSLSLPAASGIPPLTIDNEAPHQAVGALKGALSVSGDGSASYSVPIDIPKGTGGMEPKLSLGYSSGGGNGVMGVGWNLSGLQRITRGPSSAMKEGSYDPVDFDANDRFFLDGERLVCVAGNYGAAGSEYRTEMDSYARITAIGTGPHSWKVETKAGLTMTLGETADSKISVPAGTLSWGVTKVQDSLENYYTVEYARDAPTANFDFINYRVAAIRYTGNTTKNLAPYCSVEFAYEARPDISRSYSTHAGYLINTRLSKILVKTGNYVNHSYQLTYSNSFQSGRSFLSTATKLIQDSPSLAVPTSHFSYDGITEAEPLWRDPGESNVPCYGDLEGNNWVNSSVTTESNGTIIRLVGDVARGYKLPLPGVTLNSDTMIQFDFKSDKLVSGALIGLDKDTLAGTYSTSVVNLGRGNYSTTFTETQPAALYQIGGVQNTIVLSNPYNINPFGVLASSVIKLNRPVQPYTLSEGWKTFTLPIGSLGSGLQSYLVLACVDENSSDGVNDASFRNVRIYRSGSQQATDVPPIVFDVDTEIFRLSDGDGYDLGITALDMNGDGLVDLTDWRVQSYNNSGASPPYFKPISTGSTFRNVGGTFASDSSLTPPSDIPLGICSRRTNGDTASYYSKHYLLAQPMDVDGDGNVDYCVSSDIRTTPGFIRNEYTFQTQINGVWTQKPEWKLPFVLANVPSSTNDGGKPRTEHFIWSDINVDGYPDLIFRTTASGELFNPTTGNLDPAQKIVNTSGSAVFLNKGKNGPGWIRDDSYNLPEPMLWGQKDIARRLVDLDGDGIRDIAESYDSVRRTYRMNQTGSNRWNSTPGLVNPPASSYDLPTDLRFGGTERDSARIMMDANGDGLVDIITSRDISPFEISTWINQGTRGVGSPWKLEVVPTSTALGNFSNQSYSFMLPLSSSPNSGWIHYGFEQMDVNGDGLADFLYSDKDSTLTLGSDNTAILNTGNGWSRRDAWGLPGTHRIYTSNSDRETGKRRVRFMDLNGDGFPDLITNILGQTPKVWFNQCRPEVLKSVTDGFGAELQVNYSRLNDPTPTAGFGSRVYEKGSTSLPAGQSAVIDSRLVVSSYSESDGRGGRRVRAQRYGDLRYDRHNETSLGFGWIEAKDLLNQQLTRTDNRRDYPFAGSPERTRTWVEVRPIDLTVPTFSGVTAGLKCLSEETATYSQMPDQAGISGGGIIRRPVQTGSVKTLYDLMGNVISCTTTTQALEDFDAHGFVKRSTVSSLDGTSVITTSEYNHIVDPTRWFLGRLSTATVVKQGQGKPAISKTSSFTYSPTNGLLKSETVEPGNPLTVTKTYSHDDFGNVTGTSITGSGLTRSSSSIFDPQGRFLLSESNALLHTTSYNYNYQNALLQSTTDSAGRTTSFGYDAFGTLIRTFHPDGTLTGESTAYSNNTALPVSVSQYITNPITFVRAKQASGTPVGKAYFDRLGREVAVESTILRDANATGAARYSKIYTVTQYDTLGRKTLLSQAFGAGDNPNFTRFYYDLLSRPLITQHPDGTSDQAIALHTVTLGGQPVTYSKAINAKTGILEQWRDQHDRMIQTLDASGQTTLFSHDLENRLVSVSVGGVSLLTNTFDKFGNKTSVSEANSGTSTSVYNALGEVTSSTNANGQTTSFTYDSLGRPHTVVKPEGTFTTEYLASGPAIGSPWRTTGPAGYQETISYDSLGRPLATSKTQFGETFTTSTVYDALSRTVSTTDAGGLTVLNDYDPLYSIPVRSRIGLGSSGAGTVLWQAGTFDSRGRALTQTLAQGVSASAAYNPTTGLVTSTTSLQGGTPLQNKSYDWDALGNLTSRTDVLTGRTETFTYDNLNRVTQAAVSGTGSLPVSDFTYAANGNLLTKSGASLTYGGTRPHAVSTATIKGQNRAYVYDAAGYVTSDSKRTYTWTSFGQLSTLDYLSAPALQNLGGTQIYAPARVQTDFLFDAGGNRAFQSKQRIAANDNRILEETLYLGGYEREKHSTRTSGSSPPITTRTVHRHSIGGLAVYTRTILPGVAGQQVKLTTILKDHLGSKDVLYTSTWNGSAWISPTTERQSFDAWGERRDPTTLAAYRTTDSDPFRTSGNDYDRGYTSHEQLDDSGLIHMNGRIYDPELGRMLSPDPFVQVPEYSQNFNRYSYVMNNPLNLTDPSGFSWLSKTFKKLTNWVKENWRTIVAIVVVIVAWYLAPYIIAGFYGAAGIVTTPAVFQGAAGALAGAMGGAANAAIAGGDASDILRGALVGGIQGGISGGILHKAKVNASSLADKALHVAGHGVLGGASNVAMGGKFQDGFLSAAAGAAASWTGIYGAVENTGVVGRTITAGIIGGTASALGGGKFANGAWTAAFQHLLNAEAGSFLEDLKSKNDALKANINSRFGRGNHAEITFSEFLQLSMSDIEFVKKLTGYIQSLSGDDFRRKVGDSFADGVFFEDGWAGKQFTITGIPRGVTSIYNIQSTIVYSGSDLNYIKWGMISAARWGHYGRSNGSSSSKHDAFEAFIWWIGRKPLKNGLYW